MPKAQRYPFVAADSALGEASLRPYLLVSAIVEPFPPVRLAFAWSEAEHVPLLLGQINFFLEFNVCFYRSQLAFEVAPKG